MEQKPKLPKLPKVPLTAEQLEVRVWAFVVIAVTVLLITIVLSILYSVTFVTQPIKSMAPIDLAYTKMLNDIVLLIVGGVGGIMGKRITSSAARALAEQQRANPPPSDPYNSRLPCGGYPIQSNQYTTPYQPVMPDFNWMGYTNPDLDETWVPPPPPTTPPEWMEPDNLRSATAFARTQVAT
jgi:hypothetical protein